jgi:multiple sugar transport system ATP-binding protein
VAQQIGTAADIYHSPQNRFVAGFLGSPSMNFLEGRLVQEAGSLFFDEGSGRLQVPAKSAQQLEAHVGQQVVLGVRPELLSDREHAHFGTDGNVLNMMVRQVQMLGDCLHVYLSTEKHRQIVAAVDGYAQFKAKDTVPMYVDMQRSLFFAADAQGARLNDPLARGDRPLQPATRQAKS